MTSIPLSSITLRPSGAATRRRLLWAAGASVALSLTFFGTGKGPWGVIFFALASVLALSGALMSAVGDPRARRLLGPGTFARRGERVTLTAAQGSIELDVRSVVVASFEGPDTLVIEKRDGTAIELSSDEPARLASIASDLEFSPAIVHRIELLSPGDRSSSLARIGGALTLFFAVVMSLASTIGVVGEIERVFSKTGGRAESLVFSMVATMVSYALTGSLLWFFRRKEAVVGADGLSYGFVKRHFVPYVRVTEVERDAKGVRLFLDDGQVVKLPVVFWGPDDAVTALFDRIEKARGALGTSDVTAQNLARLDRGGRSRDEWTTALEALATDEGSYRATGFEPESLARIAEDAAEPPERRVGAILASRKAADPQLKMRLRAAAAACVDDDLKAALEAAAEGEVDEEAIERATHRRETPGPRATGS